MLHTWSLSVEEQFYLIFPFLLIFAYKVNVIKIFLILLFLSLIFSEYLVLTNENAAFFLTPSRFWQFLVGSLIAVYFINCQLPKGVYKYFSYIGTTLIVTSLTTLSSQTRFPGIMAILPTLGTAFLIISGKDKLTLTYRVLSSKLSVFFGTISYSLYLWHWPLIVIYKLTITPILTKEDKIILFILSIIIGYFSWKYVEQTTMYFFNKNKKFIVKYLFFSMTILTILFGFSINYSSIFINELRKHFSTFINYDMQARSGKCFLHSGKDGSGSYDEGLCIKTRDSNNILLIGDSHAAHYFNALKILYPNLNVSQATASGCRPTINLKGEERCIELMEKVFHQIINENKFNTIILAGRWQTEDKLSLHNTINFLEDKIDNIIVIGPVVEYKQSLSKMLSRFGYIENKESPFITQARLWDEKLAVSHEIKDSCIGTKAEYVSAIDKLCPDKKCITVFNDNPVQFDYGHLTYDGAAIVLKNLF